MVFMCYISGMTLLVTTIFLQINEDELVYTFSLTYTPEALAGTPITRADGAIVGVQCHYQR